MRLLLTFFAALALLLTGSDLWAHRKGRSYCSVERVVGGVDIGVETLAVHLVPTLGLAEDPPSDALIVNAEARLVQQLEDQVSAYTPQGPCRLESHRLELSRVDQERSVRVALHFACPPGAITVRNRWRLELEPSSEIVCSVEGRAWAFRLGNEELDIGSSQRLPEVLKNFFVSGAKHVAAGTDHVLFVLALLLGGAFVSREQGLGRGLKRMALVITGFTLGHSLTLILAGLGLVELPSRVTESVIALSVFLVALENVLVAKPRVRSLSVAFFGLVHGFGFAGVLAETELPRRGLVSALVAFNLGIEAAQLAFCAVVFPLLYGLASRWAGYRRLCLVPLSLFVAALGALWFFQRAFDLGFLPRLGG